VLNAIVRFSIRFRGVIIALAFALLGYGIYSLLSARSDVFPEFAPPEVSIQTEAPGFAPEQVEELVTQPIENSINGVTGIESMRSRSIQGLSFVRVVFRDDTDIYLDRQLVSERLSAAASQLPGGVKPPLLTPLTSSTNTIMDLGFTSDKLSLMTLRTIADWTIRPRLLAVPGVAGTEIFGGEIRQIQFQFEPKELTRYDVSVDQVVAAARRATAIRGSGFIETANQRLAIQTEGQSLAPAEISQTVLAHQNGSNVTLGDVANVANAPAPAIGAATIGGKPGVMIVIDSAYGANTLDVTRGVNRALDNLRPDLARLGITIHPRIFCAADFIDVALHNVRESLAIGAILVVAVLFLFLFDLRIAAISCMAIPLSLLTAVIILEKMGYSLNTMTLGGLSIAIGEVVDDAVIDVENIYRRLRENSALPEPRPAFQVVREASLEVRSAVVYATFAVILVFFPVLTISGVAGRLFAPLGFAYIWAILASLVVALIVTPALCALLLAGRDLPPQEPPVVHWLKKGYRRLLERVERNRGIVVPAVVVLVAAGMGTILFMSSSFLPELREGNVIVHMTAAPGTSLGESLRLGALVTRALEKGPYVVSVAQRAGRAELGTDVVGTNSSEIEVTIRAQTGAQISLAQEYIRKTIAGFAGAVFTSNTFLTERIDETLSGFQAPIVVNIYGNDLDQLDRRAQRVAHVLSGIPGATQIQVESPPGVPQINVRLRKNDLLRWGFDPVAVLDVVRTAFEGDIVGQIYQGDRAFNVSVILDPRDRASVAGIGALPLQSPGGNYVTLGQLADIYESSGRYVILHDGARRVQTITCNVAGSSVSSVVRVAQQRIADLSLPAGMYVEFTGTAAAEAQSRRDLLVHGLLAGLGIVLLLSVVMGNWRNLLLVLVNLPFALAGGVLAGFFTGGNLSLGALIGFVTLFGITVRNSIMLISHYEHLVGAEGMSWGLDAALRGASERLAPILMTALVTGLGLLPLAIGSGDPGREIEGPMAIIILGGLVTSTALNLLVLPTLALRYGSFGGQATGRSAGTIATPGIGPR
jgi:CzcA family heavy metal efflux pump